RLDLVLVTEHPFERPCLRRGLDHDEVLSRFSQACVFLSGSKKGPSGPPQPPFTVTATPSVSILIRVNFETNQRPPNEFPSVLGWSSSSRSSLRSRSITSLTSSDRSFEATRRASGVSTTTRPSTPTNATVLPGAQA